MKKIVYLIVCVSLLSVDGVGWSTTFAQILQRNRAQPQQVPLQRVQTPAAVQTESIRFSSFTELKGHAKPVRSAAFSPDGKRIATAGEDATVRMWDANTGQELQKLVGHTEKVYSVVFSSDSRRIITASADRTTRIWDATSGRVLRTLESTGFVWSATFSSDGRRVVTTHLESHSEMPLAGITRIWDTNSGRVLRTLEPSERTFVGASSEMPNVAVFSPDGRKIVMGGGTVQNTRGGIVRIWDAASGQGLQTLEGHTHQVNSVAFSPDGKKIVTASGNYMARSLGSRPGIAPPDDTARIWDAESGRELQKLEGHTNQVNSAAFSPNGKRIVTASYDNTVRIWDTETGKELQKLEGHTDYVYSATFSLDGTKIVTASKDGSARIWTGTKEENNEINSIVVNTVITQMQTFHRTVARNDIDGVKTHVANGADVNAKDVAGYTALHSAVMRGNIDIEMVEFLVSKGADVNAKSNDNGSAPLHWAVGNIEAVKFLVSKGADVNAKNNGDLTPFHWAAMRGSVDVIKFLISKGADVNAKGNEGETPLDVAKARGNTAVVEYLTSVE